VAAIKYSFTQADEILPKINGFKQYYVCKQEFGITILMIFVALLEVCGTVSSYFY